MKVTNKKSERRLVQYDLKQHFTEFISAPGVCTSGKRMIPGLVKYESGIINCLSNESNPDHMG